MGSTSIYAWIWQSVSFPPDRDVTDSDVYRCILCGHESAGWRASGLEGAECCVGREIRPGPGGATNMGQRSLWFHCIWGILRWLECLCHGTINGRSYSDREYAHSAWTVSGPRHQRRMRSAWLLEEQWLKDCLSRYSSQDPIDSLEKLHDVRARMNSEVVEGARGGGGHVRGGGGSPTMEALFGCHRSSWDSMMIKVHGNRAGPASSRARCRPEPGRHRVKPIRKSPAPGRHGRDSNEPSLHRAEQSRAEPSRCKPMY